MTDYLTLPTFADSAVHVVIETPKGAKAKLKYKTDLGVFAHGRPLPLGLVYPFDWGFIPSTLGEDGDPLDGLVLHEAATAPGILIPCKVLGVLQVSQTEKGKTKRNVRFLLRPIEAPRDDALDDIDALSDRMKQELEQFFVASLFGTGKHLDFLGWKGPEVALEDIRKGAREFAKS